METASFSPDFLGVTKPGVVSTDYTGYPQFFQDDEIVLNRIDYIFYNVFDRMFYQTSFPKKLFTFIFCLTNVQALFGNTFFSNDNFYNYMVMILLITNPFKMNPALFYEFGYIFFTLTVIIWAAFLSISFVIYKQKYITKIPLAILSFLIYIINPLLLNPTTYLIKRLIILILMMSSYSKGADNSAYITFLKYFANEDFSNYKDSITNTDRKLLILLLAFLIIAVILQTVMTIISFRLLSVTPYVSYNIFSGLSMKTIFYSFFLQPIIRLLESFFGFFPRWATLTLYASNIVLYLLVIYFVFLFPLLHSAVNSMTIGYSLSGILASVIKLAYSNSIFGIYYPHFLSVLVLYFVASIVSYLIFTYPIKKKYITLLSYNGETNMVDLPQDKRRDVCNLSTVEKDEIIKKRVLEDEKIQVVPYSKKMTISLTRISSRIKILFLIKTGAENACDLFIDYTLFKFLISYFPEDRELLQLISIIEMSFPYMRTNYHNILPIIRMDVLDFSQRFLIFEINTLNKLTEVDLSSSSSKELAAARTSSAKYQDNVMNTWLLDKITISALEDVITSVHQGEKMWNYILSKYPNLIEAHKLYQQFSIECKADFYQAELTNKQIRRIEEHKLNIKDTAFISLVRTFPIYLTHNIVTPEGFLEVFNNTEVYKEEPENSENLSSFTEPKDYESRLRFAIFRATNKANANSSKFMEIVIFFFFLVFVAAEFGLALYYYQSFSNEMENTDILRYYRYLTSNLSLANSYVILKYSTLYSKNSTIDDVNTTELNLLVKNHKIEEYEFDFFYYYNKYNLSNFMFDTDEDNLNFDILTRSLLTIKSFQLLYTELKNLDYNSFYDVTDVNNLMFNSRLNLQVCYDAKKMKSTGQDIPRAIAHHTINQITLSYNDDLRHWLNSSNSFCTVFSTYDTITTALRSVRYRTYQTFMNTNRNKKREILLTTLLVSVICTVAYLIVFIIANVQFLKELHSFADILSSLDDEEKRNGANPILIDNTSTNLSARNNANAAPSDKNLMPIKYSAKRAYYLMVFFCCALIIIQGVFLFFIGYIAYRMKTYDLSITYWSFFNKLRIPHYLEIFNSLSLTAILRTHVTNATTYEYEKNHCYELIETTETSNTYLVSAIGDGPSILGKSDIFDEYYLRTTCIDYDGITIGEIDDYIKPYNYHTQSENKLKKPASADDPYEWIDDKSDMYTDAEFECMSMSTKILIFIQISRDIIQKIERETMSESLNDYIVSRISYLFYILNKYIVIDLNTGDNIIMKINQRYLSNSKRNIILLLVFSVIFSIISFIVSLSFKRFLNSIYHGGIILVRRLDPNEMTANHRLVSFLLNKGINKSNSHKEMNVTQTIVHYTSDMLFYLTNNGIILITNNSILQNLGFAQEQIVGKSIYSLFEEESKKEIQKKISLLEKNEEQSTSQFNATCYTATLSQIYVSIILYQTSSKHLVIIMKNLKDILEKQRILQEMKNNYLALYYSILPSFVARLKNIEEKDISFLVPTATIMFVDIVHFSDFFRTLSPEKLLGALSMIYNQYDSKLSQYKSLTKIKIIGDIFMVAGGLFNTQGDKKNSMPPPPQPKVIKPKEESKSLKRNNNTFNTSSNIDLPVVPLNLQQINYSSTLLDIQFNNQIGNSNLIPSDGQEFNNNNGGKNNSDFINPSFSDIESALQSEQIMFQSSIARMESDFMTPDASVASQAIRFGFDTIEVVEDINMKNNFSLSVRAGISTGGPIVAGVLGDDRLDFEIFGEEISFTASVLKNGVPGKVIISDSTYNLISNLQYTFEDREMFIKGKGNFKAHIGCST